MLVGCLQDYGLDDVISAVCTPSPCHQSSSVSPPPSSLDDDVICGCPPCALPILPLKWPIHIAFIHYSARKAGIAGMINIEAYNLTESMSRWTSTQI